jgi:hypothetical protein
MARDGSGNYNLPGGNPVIPSTTISSTHFNATLSDVAAALTGSLPRDGQAAMTGPFRLPDGTQSVPAFAFNGEAGTGLFRAGTNILAFAVGAAERMRISSGNLIINATSDTGHRLQVTGTANITGNTAVGGTLGVTGVLTASGGVTGALTGNATTATTLQNARTIALSGAATGTATSFNGSANISIPVTDLNASNLSSGTVPSARLTGTYSISVTGNAGTVAGYSVAEAATGGTVPVRSGSGYLYTTYLNQSSSNSENPTVSQVWVNNGSDGFLRKASISHLATAVGAQSVNTSGTWQFESIASVGTASAGGRLQAHATSGAAVMSFHRSGAYAVNMGLDTDNVFRLGGWSDGAGAYRFTVNSGGHLAADSFGPGYSGSKYIRGATGSYGTMDLVGTTGSYAGLYLASASTYAPMYDTSGNGGAYNTAGEWHFYWNNTDNCLGIGGSTTSSSYKCYVNGALYATGDITAFSDKRAKTDFSIIDRALDKVAQLTGFTYSWKETGKRSVGLVAQEVEAVLPEAVHTDAETDKKGVTYNGVIALLVEAVKTLKSRVEALEAQPA